MYVFSLFVGYISTFNLHYTLCIHAIYSTMMQVNSLPVKERKISSHHTRWVHRLKKHFQLWPCCFFIHYCWWRFKTTRKPVEGTVVFPIIYKVLAPSQVVGNGISEPSTVTWDVHPPEKFQRFNQFPASKLCLQRKEVMQRPKFTHNKITTVLVVFALPSFIFHIFHHEALPPMFFLLGPKIKVFSNGLDRHQSTPKMSQQVQWSLKKAHNLSGANQHNFQA